MPPSPVLPLRHPPLEANACFHRTALPKVSPSHAAHHVLDLRKRDLQCDIQDRVRIFYRTQGIGVIFKKIIKQFLSIFSIRCCYSCSKKGPGSAFQNKSITGIATGEGSTSLAGPAYSEHRESERGIDMPVNSHLLSCLSNSSPSPTKEKALEEPIGSMVPDSHL